MRTNLVFPALLFPMLLSVATPSSAATNFGTVALPSSTSATVTLTFATAGTLGTISVLTQGVADQDFTSAGGGTCSTGATYAVAATCTVVVNFSPTTIGVRYGAVVLRDSTSAANILATAYLQGVSQAPQIGLVNAPVTAISGVGIWPYWEDFSDYGSSSYGGIAFDPTGSFYIASQINGASKHTPQTDGSPVETDFDIGANPASGPGIAIDGAGNLYIACGTVVCKETPTSTGGYTLSTPVSGFNSIFGLAVDGSGNLYFVDYPYGTAAVLYKENLQADGTYLQSIVPSSGLNYQGGLTVSPQGVIFVSDGNFIIYKETPSGNTYTQSTVDANRVYPVSLALDWNGNLFSADTAIFPNTFDPRKCRVATYGSPAIAEEMLQPDGSYLSTLDHHYISPNVIGFDSFGNKYVVDSFADCYSVEGTLYKTLIDNPTPPAVAFGSVLHGTTTSSQTVAFTNYGNLPLNISAITFPADFPKAPASAGDCAVGTALAPGANCNISFVFAATKPLNGQLSLTFAESIKITSNSFKRSQQLIQLTGTEIASTVATPVLSLAAGTYATAQTLTITESTPGASIYYTVNGSTPTSASILYTGPINVAVTETVTVVGILANYSNSAPASAHYLIQQPAAAPVFSIPAGTYHNNPIVTITDSTPGAIIYYTLNGSTPTPTTAQKYSAPIVVRNTYTLQAIAVALPAYYVGPITAAKYTLTVATPVLTPAAGTYAGPQTVAITTATNGAHIYYTTNGTPPTGNSTPYTAPITVIATKTLKVIAIATGYTSSPAVAQAYTITGPPAIPTFSVPTGTYNNTQYVTITDSVPGATLYYTLNGSTPTAASTRYTGPVAIINTHTLKAIAVVSGYPASSPATAVYTLAAATPTITPASGTYTGPQTITIVTASTAAHIYYTTNGATPAGNSTPYTGPVTISATKTVKAIAIATGYTSSAIATNTYTIH